MWWRVRRREVRWTGRSFWRTRSRLAKGGGGGSVEGVGGVGGPFIRTLMISYSSECPSLGLGRTSSHSIDSRMRKSRRWWRHCSALFPSRFLISSGGRESVSRSATTCTLWSSASSIIAGGGSGSTRRDVGSTAVAFSSTRLDVRRVASRLRVAQAPTTGSFDFGWYTFL